MFVSVLVERVAVALMLIFLLFLLVDLVRHLSLSHSLYIYIYLFACVFSDKEISIYKIYKMFHVQQFSSKQVSQRCRNPISNLVGVKCGWNRRMLYTTPNQGCQLVFSHKDHPRRNSTNSRFEAGIASS